MCWFIHLHVSRNTQKIIDNFSWNVSHGWETVSWILVWSGSRNFVFILPILQTISFVINFSELDVCFGNHSISTPFTAFINGLYSLECYLVLLLTPRLSVVWMVICSLKIMDMLFTQHVVVYILNIYLRFTNFARSWKQFCGLQAAHVQCTRYYEVKSALCIESMLRYVMLSTVQYWIARVRKDRGLNL